MALSVGFIQFVSSSDATQATGLLTFAPVGLSPTEHASLRWTHIRCSPFPLGVPHYPDRELVSSPATSHVASGFPALRAPAQFTSRVMRPIRPERLPRSTAHRKRGTPRRARASRTAIPCPTASSRILDAGTLGPDGAESSFLPSIGCMRNTDSSGLRQSISPTRAESD